jgi:hypothetical protein
VRLPSALSREIKMMRELNRMVTGIYKKKIRKSVSFDGLAFFLP